LFLLQNIYTNFNNKTKILLKYDKIKYNYKLKKWIGHLTAVLASVGVIDGLATSTRRLMPPASPTHLSASLHRFSQSLDLQRTAHKLRMRARAQEVGAINVLLTLNLSPQTVERLKLRKEQLSSELSPSSAPGSPSSSRSTKQVGGNYFRLTSDMLEEFAHASSAKDFVRLMSAHLANHRFLLPSNGRPLLHDTTFQDSKDIERDLVMVNDSLLVGSEAKYEGVVSRVASLAHAVSPDELAMVACQRFARALVNAANRTSSGGDVYELLEQVRQNCPHVMFCPDSTSQTTPLSIFVQNEVTSFCRLRDSEWSFGLVANVEATMHFLLYASTDQSFALARVSTTFSRQFGLPLASPPSAEDDGKSALHKEEFALGPASVTFKVAEVIIAPAAVPR
jgi:hypothetical protein